MNGEKLKQLIDSYMVDSRIEDNSKKTMENKAGAFKRLLEWLGDMDFNPDTVKQYILSLFDRGLQPSSVATDARKYKAFANWMAKPERHLSETRDWPALIKVPKVPDNRDVDVPSSELATEIINAGTNIDKSNVHWKINQEGRDALFFMLLTGLRVNEALYLNPGDIHLENEGGEWFEVSGKGRKEGEKDTLPLLPRAVEILRHSRTKDKRMKESQYFGVSKAALNQMLARGCTKLGVNKITCHKLRHIFATDMAKSGIPPFHLQYLMRHSSIEITMKYYIHLKLEDYRWSLIMFNPLAVAQRTPTQTMERLFKFMDEQLKINNDTHFRITKESFQKLTVEVASS